MPTSSRSRNRTQTMDPIEALLSKKLDKLESEVRFPHPRAAAVRSKLSFLKSLLAAETGGTTSAGRLSHISTRISALESIFSGSQDHQKVTFRLRLAILRNNLRQLESMLKEPFWYQSAAKIRSKISFTKSLLAVEAESEDLSSLRIRLAAVEQAFGQLSVDDRTHPSFSSTSCDTEELGVEEAVAFSSRKKIEKESSGDDYDDVQRKIGFLRSVLAAERKWKGEFADRNRVLLDDAIGSNVSSSCSCTSSCIDGGEEKEEQTEEEEKSVSGVNETGELCSAETVEGKSETVDSAKGSVEVGEGLERRLWKLRATVGFFAIAAVGVMVGSFFSEKEMAYLVPT